MRTFSGSQTARDASPIRTLQRSQTRTFVWFDLNLLPITDGPGIASAFILQKPLGPIVPTDAFLRLADCIELTHAGPGTITNVIWNGTPSDLPTALNGVTPNFDLPVPFP